MAKRRSSYMKYGHLCSTISRKGLFIGLCQPAFQLIHNFSDISCPPEPTISWTEVDFDTVCPQKPVFSWTGAAQSMRSEPFGVARAACFEQLACVFASCGASFLLIPNAVLIQIPDIQRVICARVGKITHPRVFKHLCVSDLGPNEATLSSGIFLHKHKTPRA